MRQISTRSKKLCRRRPRLRAVPLPSELPGATGRLRLSLRKAVLSPRASCLRGRKGVRQLDKNEELFFGGRLERRLSILRARNLVCVPTANSQQPRKAPYSSLGVVRRY